MKLTKKRALEICAELWWWMAENNKTSDHDKTDWPGWDKYEYMSADCPCCEYIHQHRKDDDCHKGEYCLLYELWDGSCFSETSPYLKFDSGEGTPSDAMKIVRACEKELRKLKRKK